MSTTYRPARNCCRPLCWRASRGRRWRTSSSGPSPGARAVALLTNPSHWWPTAVSFEKQRLISIQVSLHLVFRRGWHAVMTPSQFFLEVSSRATSSTWMHRIRPRCDKASTIMDTRRIAISKARMRKTSTMSLMILVRLGHECLPIMISCSLLDIRSNCIGHSDPSRILAVLEHATAGVRATVKPKPQHRPTSTSSISQNTGSTQQELQKIVGGVVEQLQHWSDACMANTCPPASNVEGSTPVEGSDIGQLSCNGDVRTAALLDVICD